MIHPSNSILRCFPGTLRLIGCHSKLFSHITNPLICFPSRNFLSLGTNSNFKESTRLRALHNGYCMKIWRVSKLPKVVSGLVNKHHSLTSAHRLDDTLPQIHTSYRVHSCIQHSCNEASTNISQMSPSPGPVFMPSKSDLSCGSRPWHRQGGRVGAAPGFTAVSGRGAQRHFSSVVPKPAAALTMKRALRKKIFKAVEAEREEHREKVVAYAVAEEVELAALKEALAAQDLYQLCDLPVDVQDALHVRAKYVVDETKREVFFFRDGSAVFWSMPEVERREVLKFLRKHVEGQYAPSLTLKETEEMDIKFSQEASALVGETLQLNADLESSHALLERYAFSNALSQSVKLAVWESMLEKLIDSMEFVIEELRDDQKITMSRREVLRKTGELFALRHMINLSSDLLDTPEFYWDRATLEPLYVSLFNHLEIARRTRVMNEKLSYCSEVVKLLGDHLNDAHHTRLEVMIIVLIMVEVVFEVLYYLERLYISAEKEAEQ